MVAAKQTVSFDSVMSALRQGKYAPVYLLMGDEGFFIDQISDFIAAHALAENERDFNQTIVFGSDVASSAVVADLARRYPLMAPRQVIIVKEAQNIRSWEGLEAYLDKPQPTTVLVICHKNGSIDGRKKIVTKARAVGIVYESKKKRDYELPAFVESYCRNRGVAVDNKAASMMAQHIGNDLSRIVSEIEKVVLALEGQGDKRITPELVETYIGVSKDYNGFELRNAIAAHDVKKAFTILKYFDSNPKAGNAYMLVPVLFSYFENLMVAYYAPNRWNENDLARFLDLRGGWAAREFITGMRNYSGVKVMAIIGKIRETDARSKGLDNKNTSIGELLRELVSFILY